MATLLLDCGWDASFDAAALEKLAAVAPNIDAVLLSHSSLAHVGALPRARSRFGLRCPVYATTPIYRMGQLGLYDAYKIGSKHTNEGAAATFDEAAFSLDEVDEAFDAIKELQFAQAVKLAGKRAASGAGASNTPATLTIAPHPAGHTVGGCFWRLSVGAEEILYCPEYNHMKERHLPAGVLPELVAQTGAKPTSSSRRANPPLPPREDGPKAARRVRTCGPRTRRRCSHTDGRGRPLPGDYTGP